MTRRVVFGCSGPIGTGLMEALAAQGAEVTGVCRSGHAEVSPGVRILAGDASDRDTTVRLARGADVIFGTMGLPYPEWMTGWPPIIDSLLAAAEATGARLVFADNLYAYGPQTAPLREDMPPTTYGRKPALRARMARMLLDAHAAGHARVAIVRASDFYGPRVRLSQLGERVIGRLLNGKPAQGLGDPDQPHTFTYAPDFVRALVTVAGADEASGEIWHVPNAPPIALRAVVAKVAALAGRPAKLSTIPGWMLSGLALVNPLMRELKELQFQLDRPYLVDHSKYATRFGSGFTPMEEGLRATVEWYQKAARVGSVT